MTSIQRTSGAPVVISTAEEIGTTEAAQVSGAAEVAPAEAESVTDQESGATASAPDLISSSTGASSATDYALMGQIAQTAPRPDATICQPMITPFSFCMNG